MIEILKNPFLFTGLLIGLLIWQIIKLNINIYRILESLRKNKKEFQTFNKHYYNFIDSTFKETTTEEIQKGFRTEYLHGFPFPTFESKIVTVRSYKIKKECMPVNKIKKVIKS